MLLYRDFKRNRFQNRFKSPVVWSAIVALILFILKNYGLLKSVGLDENSYNEFANLIFAILTVLGILNNPTDKEEF